jgi:class 3 adenylate cyclase/tetratricopeptide (TPR) repeat protein
MFCDLVNSTGLIEHHESETAFELIEEFRTLCRKHIGAYRGSIAGSMGDGILACFGYPTAQESHAEAACRCALGLLDELRSLPQVISVRIGIASGRGVLDLRRGDGGTEITAVSSGANLAARLQAEALPDQILVSSKVHEQVAGLFNFSPGYEAELRGFDAVQTVFPLLGGGSYRSQSHQRGDTPPAELVGRDAEIAAAVTAWQDRAGSRRGGSLLVRGPGGIGKSTLLRVLTNRIAGQAARIIVLYSAWFEQHTALHPLRACLEDVLAERRPDFLEGCLDRFLHGEALTDARETLSILLGHSVNTRWPPNILRERTLDCIATLLLGLAADKPTLLVVEDLHWIDPSSAEVLQRVQARYADYPLFILASSRPGNGGPAQQLQWQRVIDLAPLQDPDVDTLISGFDPELRLNDELRREIARKAEGVPLLVREFTHATLAPAGGDDPRMVVPDTLLDSFVVRLDSWTPAKTILDAAAAVGGSFSGRLIALALSRDEAEVGEALRRMADAGLLSRHGGSEGEQYDFSHALLRDAAYATLLPRQRQEVHASVLNAWRAIEPQFEQSQPRLAAHHLAGTGAGEDAVRTLLAGAQACFVRSQFSEAIGLIRQALKLLPEAGPEALAPLELQLQTLLGLTLTQLMGFSDEAVNLAFTRAWDISRRLNTSGEAEFQAIWGIWAHKLVVSETATAVELVDALGGIGQRSGKPELEMLTRAADAVMRFIIGNFAGVQPQLEAVRQYYKLEQHRQLVLAYSNDPLAMALMFHTHALAAQGDTDAADRSRAEVLRLGDELGVEFLQPYIRIWSWGSTLYHGAPAELPDIFDQSIAQAGRLGIAFWVYGGMLWKAHAYARLGQIEKAIPCFDEGLEGATRIGMRFTLSYFHSLHAWTLARTGQPQVALPIFNQCLRQNRSTGELCYQAEIHRLYGEALLHSDATARQQALHQFGRGLAVARAQGAVGWEQKILRSLGEFGFDNAQAIDLIDAK